MFTRVSGEYLAEGQYLDMTPTGVLSTYLNLTNKGHYYPNEGALEIRLTNGNWVGFSGVSQGQLITSTTEPAQSDANNIYAVEHFFEDTGEYLYWKIPKGQVVAGLSITDINDRAIGFDSSLGSGDFTPQLGDVVGRQLASLISTQGELWLDGSNGDDTLVLNAAGGRIAGKGGADDLWGASNNDRLEGDSGSDYLRGLPGDDKLFGGADADFLEGGFGNDTLEGNQGLDTFIFETKLSKKANVDRITDFDHEDDVIFLWKNTFSALKSDGKIAKKYFQTKDKPDKNDVIIRDKGNLLYDKDAKGGTKAVPFAKIDQHDKIDASDFVVFS